MTRPSQLPLFGHTPYPGCAPGSRRSETSREAAALVRPKLRDRQIEVYNAIAALGTATGNEVMDRLGVSDPNRVRPRITELAALGLIEDTGTRRRTPSGANAVAWRVVR